MAPNKVNVELGQELTILVLLSTPQHDVIYNQVVSLIGHRNDGMTHGVNRSFHDRARFDYYRRIAIIVNGLKDHPVGMSDHGLGQISKNVSIWTSRNE